jgi:hypothetical protein
MSFSETFSSFVAPFDATYRLKLYAPLVIGMKLDHWSSKMLIAGCGFAHPCKGAPPLAPRSHRGAAANSRSQG